MISREDRSIVALMVATGVTVTAITPLAPKIAETEFVQNLLHGPMPTLQDDTSSKVCVRADGTVELPLDLPESVRSSLHEKGEPANWGARSDRRVADYLVKHGADASACDGITSFAGTTDPKDYGLTTKATANKHYTITQRAKLHTLAPS